MGDINIDMDSIISMLTSFALDLVAAVIVFIIGRIIIGIIVGKMKKNFKKKDFDDTKVSFLLGLVKALLSVVLLISVAGILGVSTASIIALLGTAGLAIGLALQGSLSNLAGGFVIMILKPFKIGDWVEAQGESGTVEEVKMLHTVLKTPDNKIIYMPNAPLASGAITNYTQESERRLDLSFGIGYSDDIDKAKKILQKIMDDEPRILKDRANMIKVKELADSSVNFTWRGWLKTEDYWAVHFEMFEKVKKEFDANNISIPFPQRDVHLFKEDS